MAQLKDNQLIFHDEEGNEIVCEIIFTYDSEATGKKYVVFQAEGDESGEVGAASYVEKGNGEGELEPIETEEEWAIIEQIFSSINSKKEGE